MLVVNLNISTQELIFRIIPSKREKLIDEIVFKYLSKELIDRFSATVSSNIMRIHFFKIDESIIITNSLNNVQWLKNLLNLPDSTIHTHKDIGISDLVIDGEVKMGFYNHLSGDGNWYRFLSAVHLSFIINFAPEDYQCVIEKWIKDVPVSVPDDDPVLMDSRSSSASLLPSAIDIPDLAEVTGDIRHMRYPSMWYSSAHQLKPLIGRIDSDDPVILETELKN